MSAHQDWRDDLAVFPVEGKRPMVRWRTESAPWDEWTGRWPRGAGFGVDCGRSGLVVVDEDELGAVAAWLGRVPLTYTVRTGKGRHFYFLAPDGVTIRNGVRVAPGVDVRADGGYVVGAGSLHPSGTRYTVENGGEPRPLPAEVLTLLMAQPPAADTSPRDASTIPARAREVIADGQRGDTLFHYACSLRGRSMGDAEALALLREAWARCDPPYTERTPEAMWSHVVAEYPAGRGLVEVDGLLVERGRFEKQRQDRLLFLLADRSARGMLDEAEIASMPESWLTGDMVLDVPAVQPILGHPSAPLTARGQHTLLVGPDGSGKSTFVQHYAKARLNLPGWGGTMLGEPVEALPEDARVLYLAVDRPTQILEGFGRGLDPGDGDLRDLLRERLLMWPGPPPSPLWEKAGRLWLLRAIEARNIRMVIIDSRKDVGDTLEQREVTGFARLTKHLDADEVELIMPHHSVQNSDKKPTADLTDTFGLREVYSGAGSVLMLKGSPGAEVVTLHQSKPIREKHDPVRVRVAHLAGRVELAGAFVVADRDGADVDLRNGPGDPERDATVALHAELLKRGPTGRTEFLGRGGDGVERRHRVAALIAAGLVTEERRDRTGYLTAVDLSESTVRSRLDVSP